METLKARDRVANIASIAAAFAILGTGVTLVHHKHVPKTWQAEDIYEHAFTTSGKCLSRTGYDPVNGATITLGNDAMHGEVISVTPHNTTDQKSADLSFTVSNDHLIVANLHTAGVLIGSHCIPPNN